MPEAEDAPAKIRKRALRVFPSTAGGVALATAVAILFARWMGIGQFGAFAFAYHAIRMMALFGSMGFSQIALRYVPRYHRDGHAGLLSGFMRVGLLVTFVGGLALGGIGFLLVLPLIEGSQSHAALRHSWWLGALLATSLLLGGILRGVGRVLLSSAPQGPILNSVALAAGFLIVALGWSMDAETGILAVAAGVVVALAIQSWGLLTAEGGPATSHPPEYDLKGWAGSAPPLLILDGGRLAIVAGSVVLVRLMADEVAAGRFHAAVVLAGIVALPAQAVMAASAREIALAVHGRGDLLSLVEYCLRLILWPTLPLAVAILALGPWALGLFGPGFAAAAPLLWLLVPAMALAPMALLLGFSMTLTPFLAPMAYQFGVLTAFGLAGFAVAILLMGPMGAAAGMLVYEIAKIAFGAWVSRRYLRTVEADAGAP